jgi:hypothetical protein
MERYVHAYEFSNVQPNAGCYCSGGNSGGVGRSWWRPETMVLQFSWLSTNVFHMHNSKFIMLSPLKQTSLEYNCNTLHDIFMAPYN